METLGKDITEFLALKLGLKDSIHFSLVCNSISEKICNNDNFWMNRLIKDFPGFISSGEAKITKLRYKNLVQMGVEKDSAILFIKNSNLSSCKYKKQYFNLIEKGLNPIDSPTRPQHRYYYVTTPQMVDFLKNAKFGNIPEKYGGAPFINVIMPLLEEKHIPFFDLLCVYIDMNNLRVDGKFFKTDEYMVEKLKMKNTIGLISHLHSQNKFGKALAINVFNDGEVVFSEKGKNIMKNIGRITHEILTSR